MKEDLKASEITEVAKEVDAQQGQGISGQGGSQTGTLPTQAELQAKQQEVADKEAEYVAKSSQSSIARFNEEPFIVAVRALLVKIDLEPKIGWEVEWQAVRRELKALEESMR